MQLTNGFYYVSTLAANPWGEHWVQRNLVEDKSFAPKPVSVQVDDPAVAQWYVQQVNDSNTFQLSAGSAELEPLPTIGQDGRLYVDLTNSTDTTWIVTACGPNCDDDVFIIADVDGNAWETPEVVGDDRQIQVNYLVIPLIYPPVYPISNQFRFASVGGSDLVD